LNAFSIASPDDYDAFQRERFYQRQMELGRLIAQEKLTDAAFDALISIGSKAGYFLRASDIAGMIPVDTVLDPNQIQRFQEAVQYLEQYRNEINSDSRCLNLLFKLWWMSQTGQPIMFNERQTVPFNSEDWLYVNRLVTDLLSLSNLRSVCLLKYIQGISTFHLGQIATSINIFRELEREAESIHSRKRIVRSYLVSDEMGAPRQIHGTVAWVNDEHTRGEADIEELRCRIRFLPLDFLRGRELKKNDPLEKFHIAFNFIGPIADPVGYKRS
jgi:hypothetical protein